MRVAILTLPLHINYGGIMQCYALQRVLTRMGHDVKVLSKPMYGRLYFFALFRSYISYLYYKYIRKENISSKSVLYDLYQYRNVSKNLNFFVKNNIIKYNKRKWETIGSNFDAIIVGSDQVWRAAYHSNIEEYYLSFIGELDIKRISYAASFGLDNLKEYSMHKLKLCTRLLKKFDYVSVREDSGVLLCKEYFGVKAELVIDPTLLLDDKDYETIFNNSNLKIDKNILLAYFLDITDEKIKIAERLAQYKGLKLFIINSKAFDDKSEIKERIMIGVDEWLFNFKNSSYIITDSFHGCVFSIIFKKQFIALGNDNRGLTRFLSLLNRFSLNDRLINLDIRFESILNVVDKNIDYNTVYDKLSKEREKSYNFLYNSLK
ncbi:polysaccharide pyruvyl transferase family protein [uncultured Bacteroides sp.]|uniref:polysaccharide pyruvyl transferase family protein n=1 Tax=uncultured Bacteroides sp. TaxID=162156 RepID=UPI00262E29D4|nr:polysaccharide pyruvyl transferase family protein [uncultured Bacteroides sp.]